jgi:hypothetical protein
MMTYIYRKKNNFFMGRVPQGIADKGSQKWIQKLINEKEKQKILNSQIKESFPYLKDLKIEWRSPLKEDDYAEYRDQTFIGLLGVKLERVQLKSFWPGRVPQ